MLTHVPVKLGLVTLPSPRVCKVLLQTSKSTPMETEAARYQADMAWRVAQRKIFMDQQPAWITQWEKYGVSAETLRLIEADQVQTRKRLAANKAAREANKVAKENES